MLFTDEGQMCDRGALFLGVPHTSQVCGDGLRCFIGKCVLI